MNRTTQILLGTAALLPCLLGPLPAQERGNFEDNPEAHALYDAMIAAFRAPGTLSYRASYLWLVDGKELGDCRYYVRMKKPNRFRVDTTKKDGKKGGVLIGDGDDLWIHWPDKKPHFHTEDPAELRDKDRNKQYMRKRASVGGHSIGHETGLLGAGMSMPVFDPSTFHGYTDSLQRYLDGVQSKGTETVRGEACDVLLVSFMKGQRTWTLWVFEEGPSAAQAAPGSRAAQSAGCRGELDRDRDRRAARR